MRSVREAGKKASVCFTFPLCFQTLFSQNKCPGIFFRNHLATDTSLLFTASGNVTLRLFWRGLAASYLTDLQMKSCRRLDGPVVSHRTGPDNRPSHPEHLENTLRGWGDKYGGLSSFSPLLDWKYILFSVKQPRKVSSAVESVERHRDKTHNLSNNSLYWLTDKSLNDHITYSYVITYSISVFHITLSYWQMEYSIRSSLTPFHPIYNLAARLDFLVFQPERSHILQPRERFHFSCICFPLVPTWNNKKLLWNRSIQGDFQFCFRFSHFTPVSKPASQRTLGFIVVIKGSRTKACWV